MNRQIAIDMDEVLARYTEHVIETLYLECGITLDMEKLQGRFLSQSLDPGIVEIVSSYPYRKGFFRNLRVIPHSQEVLKGLMDHFNIFIVSACLQHPNSLMDKLLWLNENFPFIPNQQIIFCGEKSFLGTDFLIDDHPKHLESFKGTPLLFSAFHNTGEKRFRRFDNWLQIDSYLKDYCR